jgi:pimeloyl-ACP methyl ester carboxylesterase
MRWLVVALAACGDSGASGTTALFEAAGTGSDFYALPFPNDLRRHDDGTLDLSLFPTNSIIAGQYRDVAQTLDGFSLNGQMSSRLSGAIDPMTLPDPAGSIGASPSVFLVNVDLNSADYGMLTPIIASFRTDGTNTIGGNRLVARPYPGYPLDEGTTYALVITRAVLDVGGKPIERSPDFAALMGSGGGTAVQRARTVYGPLLAYLGANQLTDQVVSAAVFTTQHATFVGPAIRKGVFATPAPTATMTGTPNVLADYTLYTGTYVAPNFQSGDVPYLNSGGEIQYDTTGAAIVQRMENMRFALTIPTTTMPPNGWPICIYQHGTGGDWQSFIQDGTGDALAKQGIAVISTDQVLHGPRNPSGEAEVDFFNFGNPYAGRDNPLQGGADAWSQMRLALGIQIGTDHFDPNNLMFFGHSQGGLTGPPFIAFEPSLKGAVLSGTGGVGYLGLLYKLAPVNFPMLVETLTRDSPMDEDNPTLALAQMWIERSDGVNYARMFVSGQHNIFQTEGFTDTYAPNKSIEAFATSVGGDIVKTADEADVPGLTQLRKSAVVSPPFGRNRGLVTDVLAQYKMAAGSDGHFVVFDIAAARAQSSNFLGTLASTGQATVTLP